MNDTESGMENRLARIGHPLADLPTYHAPRTERPHGPVQHAHATRGRKPKPTAGQALLGIHIDPAWTGIIRAVAYVVLTAVLDLAIIYFKAPPEGLVIYSATIVGALRALEGIADQILKGNASAAPPQEQH